MLKSKILKVGFDLDGVILYNPARNVRPILAYLRKKILKKEKSHFYIPTTMTAKMFWWLVHKSSIMPARGLAELKSLTKKKKIHAYLITARYDSLRRDFDRWMNRIDAKNIFVKFVHNDANMQPHEFKKKMIKELDLDYFVEDNWDIIRLIKKKKHLKTKLLWITNLLDRNIAYEYKFKNLHQAVQFLKNKANGK